jgi:hypothetical protein
MYIMHFLLRMDDISTGLGNLEHILDRKRRPGKLKLSVLSHITANFSDEQKIGEGGCGHVYKVNHFQNSNRFFVFPHSISYQMLVRALMPMITRHTS